MTLSFWPDKLKTFLLLRISFFDRAEYGWIVWQKLWRRKKGPLLSADFNVFLKIFIAEENMTNFAEDATVKVSSFFSQQIHVTENYFVAS